MSGWDLGGAYRTSDDRRWDSAERRRINREAGACVNETKHGTHGPATHGVRCKRCAERHGGYSMT